MPTADPTEKLTETAADPGRTVPLVPLGELADLAHEVLVCQHLQGKYHRTRDPDDLADWDRREAELTRRCRLILYDFHSPRPGDPRPAGGGTR